MRDIGSKIAGSIAGAAPVVENLSPTTLAEKLSAYRDKQLTGYDGVFDAERGTFLIAGRHPTLVGVEAIIAVDLASMVTMVGQVMPGVVVPLMIQGMRAARPAGTP